MKFTNNKSGAVRVHVPGFAPVVVGPGETIGDDPVAEKPKSKKKGDTPEPTASDEVAELSEEDAS